MTYSTLEKEILQLINQHRTQNGLLPLTFEDNIQELSMEHSSNMATKQRPFGHDGFQQRAETLLSNLNGIGAAENVAMGQRSAQEVVSSWLNSPGHRKNIEGDFNLTGIGIAHEGVIVYYCQIFIKK